MASSSLGFLVVLVGIVLGGVMFLQSGLFLFNEITDAHASELEEIQDTKNEDLDIIGAESDVDTQNGESITEVEISVTNNGEHSINAHRLTMLFENEYISLREESEYNGNSVEPISVTINGNSYPGERTHVPPDGEINAVFEIETDTPPERVKIITMQELEYGEQIE